MMMASDFSRRSRPMPPVSTSVKDFPPHSASAVTPSRVTPGWSWTIAMRLPTMRLNSADLPAFGRPTMAIKFDTKNDGQAGVDTEGKSGPACWNRLNGLSRMNCLAFAAGYVRKATVDRDGSLSHQNTNPRKAFGYEQR